jgi:hypothetical protein
MVVYSGFVVLLWNNLERFLGHHVGQAGPVAGSKYGIKI